MSDLLKAARNPVVAETEAAFQLEDHPPIAMKRISIVSCLSTRKASQSGPLVRVPCRSSCLDLAFPGTECGAEKTRATRATAAKHPPELFPSYT